MKKIIAILVAAVAVCVAFSSCQKTPATPTVPDSLVGKTYTSSQVLKEYESHYKEMKAQFLTDKDVKLVLIGKSADTGDVTVEGTYTYDKPNLVITALGKTYGTGVVDATGVDMTFGEEHIRFTLK